MARILENVYDDYAKIIKTWKGHNLTTKVGMRTAHLLETLGDILNGMDAITEDDAWINPVIIEARRKWPQPSEEDEILAHMEMLVRTYAVADDDSLTDAAKSLKRRILFICAPLMKPSVYFVGRSIHTPVESPWAEDDK
jgi:hypothetical protein